MIFHKKLLLASITIGVPCFDLVNCNAHFQYSSLITVVIFLIYFFHFIVWHFTVIIEKDLYSFLDAVVESYGHPANF